MCIITTWCIAAVDSCCTPLSCLPVSHCCLPLHLPSIDGTALGIAGKWPLVTVCLCADSLTAQFSSAGKVIMVRICQPNSGPRSVAQTVQGADLAVSRQLHALVEYSNAAEVAVAVKHLTDGSNW